MKNPFQLYAKLDETVVARLNDLYLWALDWTGVYVGTLIFLNAILPAMNAIQRDHSWVAAILMFCTLITAAPRYYLQGMSTEAYNRLVLGQIGVFISRTVFNSLNVLLLVMHILMHIKEGSGLLPIASDINMIFMWYLVDIKVRDREKKDFRLPKLAMEKMR